MGMRCLDCYEYVEKKIGNLFADYGRFISHHAWKTIVICIIINGGLAVGMLRLKSDIDTGNVYYPQGSQARDDKERVENLFPDLSGERYNALQLTQESRWARIIVRSKNGNLLIRSELSEVKKLAQRILNITASNSDGSTIEFSDVCAQSNGACAVEGDLFWDDEFLAAVDHRNVTYPEFFFSMSGTRNYASRVGGKVTVDKGTNFLTLIEYIQVSFVIRTDESEEKAIKWADKFLEFMSAYSSQTLEVAYGHFKSRDEELDKNVSGDITLFSITFTLMITYACLSTISARVFDQVGQRLWLGFAGILAAGLAIISSFGFCAAIGVEFVSIVGVLPFLIIGIGIDDMFILLSGLSEAQKYQTVEDRIAETLRISGVGITITSLTDIIAFLAGISSVFLGVKNFCIYTAVAVFFCYVNNVTLFTCCLAINERRVLDNRHFLTCRQIKSKERLQEENKSTNHILCCGGTAPKNREEAEGVADRFPRWCIPKLVLRMPLKIIIVVLFMGYLAAGIYGCINLKQGLLLSNLVNEDSYFYKYSEWEEKHFPRQIPVAFVISSTHQYSTKSTQDMIESLVSTAQANRFFDDAFEVVWLKSYTGSVHFRNSTESAFIQGLYNFVADLRYSRFYNDFIIDSTNQSITYSRVYIRSANLADSQEEGEMMLESRKIAEASAIDCFAFAPSFLAFEQYVAILGQSLQTVGIALATVFVVTCFFMPHPLLIFFVTVAVTMIMVGVFGYLLFIDVSLSAITMIHLIMSVGFSIDFTAHICHGYMISKAVTRHEKVKDAIDKTGAPIFHGAISSLLGIIVLFWAKSYIFRTFGIVMAFVLLFGITHALLLLPVVLSVIGPMKIEGHVQSTPTCCKTPDLELKNPPFKNQQVNCR